MLLLCLIGVLRYMTSPPCHVEFTDPFCTTAFKAFELSSAYLKPFKMEANQKDINLSSSKFGIFSFKFSSNQPYQQAESEQLTVFRAFNQVISRRQILEI